MIRFTQKDLNLIIDINGEIDHHVAKTIREKIDMELILSNCKNIVFDFKNLKFMDSSGIGIIMGRYKNVNSANGSVSIINMSKTIKKILDLSGVFNYVQPYENLQNALKNN